ncbi:phytase [Aureibaculum algae]|uniref:Phytase n=1 Tax=Aureibaculum algae TaxID=2584122 RepID=A0A5B7TZG6_9FLAO|nr:phytase [Aureibaculum algae]QCX40711.1 phytase [Aureibaculum algae]
MNKLIIICCALVITSCKKQLPVIAPNVITEKIPHDSDDPAIWINKKDPSKSIVFGTDKDEVNGGVYAFDLNGKIIKEKSITNISYPNNVDIEYDFKLNDSTSIDILVFTEREKHQIRLFSVPDMKALDNGGFKVFEDETNEQMKRPMGIALYNDPESGVISAIISRKKGPKEGYLYQYEFISDSTGIRAKFLRKFGKFSGTKEIEAIAIDDKLGYVYYSDEAVGIRKYHANPKAGNDEIAIFGGNHFKDDIEGIAIATYENDKGYLIVSNQQNHSFNFFKRSDNTFIKSLNLGTLETDGCEVVTVNLNGKFKMGLFVAMNDEQNFKFYSLEALKME